jgi:hypothetical protein
MRKLARQDVAIIDVLIDEIERRHPADMKLLAVAVAVRDKLVALLPRR